MALTQQRYDLYGKGGAPSPTLTSLYQLASLRNRHQLSLLIFLLAAQGGNAKGRGGLLSFSLLARPRDFLLCPRQPTFATPVIYILQV